MATAKDRAQAKVGSGLNDDIGEQKRLEMYRTQVVIREADTGRPVAGNRPHQVAFPADPLPVHGMVIRLLDCVFPRPGLYHVEFRFEGEVIAHEPLLVR